MHLVHWRLSGRGPWTYRSVLGCHGVFLRGSVTATGGILPDFLKCNNIDIALIADRVELQPKRTCID